MKSFLLIAAVLTLAACSADDQGASTAKTTNAVPSTPRVIYQKAFDCGASGELDVDTGERRNLKLVIKDPAAIDYLESKLPSGGQLSNDVLGPDGTSVVTRGVLRFGASDGVFKPGDFSRAGLPGGIGFTGTSEEYAEIHKEADGIKIQLANYANVRVTCADGRPIVEQGCNGGGTKTTILKEDANWFFHCKSSF